MQRGARGPRGPLCAAGALTAGMGGAFPIGRRAVHRGTQPSKGTFMNLCKPLAAAVVAAFIAPAVTFAQTPADESSRLAAHLGLPDTATVTAAALPGVPAASPLRVYLAFGMDMQVRDNFLGWIKKWNDKDAKKQGAI